MTDATTVWTEVGNVYPSATLKALTNLHDRTASSADATVGAAAAEHALDLWPMYTEIAFDVTNTLHLGLAVKMTMAVLLDRRHPGSDSAKRHWDAVFGDDGLVNKFRRTGVRGRRSPVTSGPDTRAGQNQRGWSHRLALPKGFMPSTIGDTGSGDDV